VNAGQEWPQILLSSPGIVSGNALFALLPGWRPTERARGRIDDLRLAVGVAVFTHNLVTRPQRRITANQGVNINVSTPDFQRSNHFIPAIDFVHPNETLRVICGPFQRQCDSAFDGSAFRAKQLRVTCVSGDDIFNGRSVSHLFFLRVNSC
jgi:hypothetical protein